MKKELLGTSENTLISHTLIHFIFPKYINCSSLPCLKAQKAHKSSGSLVYLEHNNSIKHSFKRRGGGHWGSSWTEITGCHDISISKTEYLVPQESTVFIHSLVTKQL